jgi:hypothetical protein
MDKGKLIQLSFVHSLGVMAYIMVVAWIINNAEKFFGKTSNFWGPVMFLMLFVFSALLTGILVLGRPIWMYLQNKKQEALYFLFVTVGWMFVLLVLAFAVKIFV